MALAVCWCVVCRNTRSRPGQPGRELTTCFKVFPPPQLLHNAGVAPGCSYGIGEVWSMTMNKSGELPLGAAGATTD